MAVFQAAAANRKLPIAYTYQSAAQQVDTICGPGFVNDTLPAPLASAARTHARPLPEWLVSLLLLACASYLLL